MAERNGSSQDLHLQVVTRVYASADVSESLPDLELVEKWLSSPIDRSSIRSREDLTDLGAPSTLRDFFLEYGRALDEGRVDARPAEEFREWDLQNLHRLETCGPYHVSVEVES